MVYLGRLWTLDGQPAPRCNREAKADPMGAFVRDAHFVRSPALAPAPAAVPETKPPHTPLRTAHDRLRLASPAASCLAALRPGCPHPAPPPRCCFPSSASPRPGQRRMDSALPRGVQQRPRGGAAAGCRGRRRQCGEGQRACHPPRTAIPPPSWRLASRVRPKRVRGGRGGDGVFIYTKSAWFVRGTPILGASTHF